MLWGPEPHFPHTQYSSSGVWTGNCSKFFPMAGRAKEWVCIMETSEGHGFCLRRQEKFSAEGHLKMDRELQAEGTEYTGPD